MANGMLSRANRRAIALSSSPGATHHPDQTSARTDHTTHPGNNLQESLRPRERDERFRNFRSLLGLGRDSTIRSREWPRQTHFTMRFRSSDAMWSAPEQHMLQF